ncbi:MAG: hypothetical protein IPP50_00135 [Piscinibacter sp.]|nr:hypothetical protein [Piscinibacter sp.]
MAGQHPRFVIHFPADRVMAEHGRALLPATSRDKRIRRDSFTSVPELELTIDLSSPDNIDPKPFIWAASASEILAKVMGATAALATVSRQVHNRSAHYTRWVSRVDA